MFLFTARKYIYCTWVIIKPAESQYIFITMLSLLALFYVQCLYLKQKNFGTLVMMDILTSTRAYFVEYTFEILILRVDSGKTDH